MAVIMAPAASSCISAAGHGRLSPLPLPQFVFLALHPCLRPLENEKWDQFLK